MRFLLFSVSLFELIDWFRHDANIDPQRGKCLNLGKMILKIYIKYYINNMTCKIYINSKSRAYHAI